MFLHIGADIIIHEKNIIAILDMDSTTASKDSREFLKTAEKKGFIESISDELPKTIIITKNNGQYKIYMSPISSATLVKRTEFPEGVSLKDFVLKAMAKCRLSSTNVIRRDDGTADKMNLTP